MISPKLVPAILLAIAALRGESICGKDDRNPTANVDLVQVYCIDFDRLRELAPQHPWPVGKVTQVLVHVREGDAVRVMSAKRDDLQAAMALLRKDITEIPISFNNFRD